MLEKSYRVIRSYKVWLVALMCFAVVLMSGCAAVNDAKAPTQAKAVAVAAKPASLFERITTEGIVVGQEDAATQTISWKGIPYVQPPVGDLRWKAPKPALKRAQPLMADKFCSMCPQYVDHDGKPTTPQIIVGNEDCLAMNIWAPKGATGSLPVFFWIHGGGNSIQWPLLSKLDGGILAARGNMVVVSFNYRLGPMGFFSHPVLRTGDDETNSGNFAILDMIAALKWVQTNIKNFGGDPANVTIVGESAGGQNVYALVASPLAKGLFHRAISQSGVIRPSNFEEGAVHVGHVLARRLVKDGRAADEKAAFALLAGMSAKDIEAYMRSKSPAELLEAYPEGPTRGMILIPTTFADGKVLPADFYGALSSGKYNQVPMILGTNKEEAKLFLRNAPPFRDWFADGSIYKTPEKLQLWELAAKYQSDGWKAMAVDQPARILRDNVGQPPVYAYQFLWGAGGAKNPTQAPPRNIILGACHAMEIDFVFGTDKASLGAFVFNDKNKPGRVALSNAMMDYWSAFARTGNPNLEKSALPKWEPWSNIADRSKIIMLDADFNAAKIAMSNSELTQEAILEALKAEPRQTELQPFWDASPYRRR